MGTLLSARLKSDLRLPRSARSSPSTEKLESRSCIGHHHCSRQGGLWKRTMVLKRHSKIMSSLEFTLTRRMASPTPMFPKGKLELCNEQLMHSLRCVRLHGTSKCWKDAKNMNQNCALAN